MVPSKPAMADLDFPRSSLLAFVGYHCLGLYGLYHLPATSLWTVLFLVSLEPFGLGTTAGAHRLWTHGSYKASTPLKLFLLLAYCIAAPLNHFSVYSFVKLHRLHHKYSETDADPHNSKRGFLFAHCTWLLQPLHPAAVEAGERIDMSDVTADRVIMFQHRHHTALRYSLL